MIWPARAYVRSKTVGSTELMQYHAGAAVVTVSRPARAYVRSKTVGSTELMQYQAGAAVVTVSRNQQT